MRYTMIKGRRMFVTWFVIVLASVCIGLVAALDGLSVSFGEAERMEEANEVWRNEGPVQFWLRFQATDEDMKLLSSAESVQTELDEATRRWSQDSTEFRRRMIHTRQEEMKKRNSLLARVRVREGNELVPFWGLAVSRAPNAHRYLMSVEDQDIVATEHLQFVGEKWVQSALLNLTMSKSFCLLQTFDERRSVRSSLTQAECHAVGQGEEEKKSEVVVQLHWKDAPGTPFIFTTRSWSLAVKSIHDHRIHNLESEESAIAVELDEKAAFPVEEFEQRDEAERPVTTHTKLRLSDELRRTGPSGDVYEQMQIDARKRLLSYIDARLLDALSDVDEAIKNRTALARQSLHDAHIELKFVDGSFFGMFADDSCSDVGGEILEAASRDFVLRGRERRQLATSFFFQELCGVLSESPAEYIDQLKTNEE